MRYKVGSGTKCRARGAFSEMGTVAVWAVEGRGLPWALRRAAAEAAGLYPRR